MSLIVALLLASTAVAKPPADPCAKSKTETDAFSGEQKLIYGALLWTLETTPKGSSWVLKVGAGGAVDTVLKAGWTLRIKLDDGSVMELHSEADAAPRMQASQYGVTTQWTPRFVLTPTEVQTLAGGAITAMRFDTGTGSGEQTWEGNDAFRKNIAEAFGCAVTKQPAAITP